MFGKLNRLGFALYGKFGPLKRDGDVFSFWIFNRNHIFPWHCPMICIPYQPAQSTLWPPRKTSVVELPGKRSPVNPDGMNWVFQGIWFIFLFFDFHRQDRMRCPRDPTGSTWRRCKLVSTFHEKKDFFGSSIAVDMETIRGSPKKNTGIQLPARFGTSKASSQLATGRNRVNQGEQHVAMKQEKQADEEVMGESGKGERSKGSVCRQKLRDGFVQHVTIHKHTPCHSTVHIRDFPASTSSHYRKHNSAGSEEFFQFYWQVCNVHPLVLTVPAGGVWAAVLIVKSSDLAPICRFSGSGKINPYQERMSVDIGFSNNASTKCSLGFFFLSKA